jgi:predicted nucleic acid-binding protein
MRRVLFDSSLYIESLQRSDGSLLLARSYMGAPIHLSSVVVEELYAGADDARAEAAVERLHRSFSRVGRVVTPNDSDWAETGRLLARIGRKYGYERIGRSRLTNDALIGISARRLGIAVATLNVGDFKIIQEFNSFKLVVVSISQ